MRERVVLNKERVAINKERVAIDKGVATDSQLGEISRVSGQEGPDITTNFVAQVLRSILVPSVQTSPHLRYIC